MWKKKLKHSYNRRRERKTTARKIYVDNWGRIIIYCPGKSQKIIRIWMHRICYSYSPQVLIKAVLITGVPPFHRFFSFENIWIFLLFFTPVNEKVHFCWCCAPTTPAKSVESYCQHKANHHYLSNSAESSLSSAEQGQPLNSKLLKPLFSEEKPLIIQHVS